MLFSFSQNRKKCLGQDLETAIPDGGLKIAIISQTHDGHPDTIVQSRSSAIHSESYMAAEYLVQYKAGGNRALNACFEVAAAALTPKSVAPNSKQNLRKPTTQSVHLVRKRHNAVLRTFFRRRKKVLPKQIVQPPLSEVKPVLLFLFFVLFFVMNRNYLKK